jgi:FkbM family methyltransferase
MPARLAKRLLQPLLNRVTLLVEPVGGMPLWASGMRALKHRGFEPRTVFDIGVAYGTPELYAAFPGARFCLVDPTREALPYMEAIAKRLDAAIFNLALGERDGTMEIEIRLDDIQGATFFKEIGPLGPTERYRVPVRRFDSVFADFARPALCKIDVQGAELMVMRGMGTRLDELDVLIVETSTIATLAGGPEAAEVLSFLQRRGFVIFDVLRMLRRPLDHALAQLDLLFVKEDSPLRADHRWCAEA